MRVSKFTSIFETLFTFFRSKPIFIKRELYFGFYHHFLCIFLNFFPHFPIIHQKITKNLFLRISVKFSTGFSTGYCGFRELFIGFFSIFLLFFFYFLNFFTFGNSTVSKFSFYFLVFFLSLSF